MSTVIEDHEAKANIGANVKRFRGDRSYSEIARACCTPTWRCYPSTIQQIENADHMPGAGLLARLAEALGVSTDDLLAAPQKEIRKSRRTSEISH